MVVKSSLFLIFFCSYAWCLDISGTVLETGTNKPVSNAQICLAPDLTTCVNTNNEGAFRLTVTTVGNLTRTAGIFQQNRIRILNGKLVFDISSPEICQLEIFDIDGRLAEEPRQLIGNKMKWPLVDNAGAINGIRLVRISGTFGIELCKVTLVGGKVLSISGASHLSGLTQSSSTSAKVMTGTDTLVIAQDGYQTATYVPVNQTETGATVHLSPFVVAPLHDSIAFVKNDTLKKSAVLDTGAFSLSVTDKSGLTWTLIVPSSAFSIKTKISMTPISPAAGSGLIGGVLFEPDGYYFSTPAKLTVSGGTVPLVIKTFNHNGSNAGIAALQKTAGPDTIDITHFSGAGGEDAGQADLSKLCATAEADYQAALKERDILLNTSLFVPEPPSIRNECYTELDSKSWAQACSLITHYCKSFGNPEKAITEKLLTSARAVALAGCTVQHDISSGFLTLLNARMVKKINIALNRYANIKSAEAYHALVPALIGAEKNLIFTGYEDDRSWVLTEVGTWADKLSNEYLRRISQEHDYAALKTVLQMNKDAAVLGVQTTDLETLLSAMTNAMTFSLTITATGDISWKYEGDPSSDVLWHAIYETKAAVLRWSLKNGISEEWQTLLTTQNPGSSPYLIMNSCTEAKVTAPDNDGNQTTTILTPPNPEIRDFALNFNACNDSGCSCSDSAFKLRVSGVGFSWPAPNVPGVDGLSFDANNWIDTAMGKPIGVICPDGPCYKYTITAPITNGSATAVDITQLGTYDIKNQDPLVHTDASIKVVMKHTPK